MYVFQGPNLCKYLIFVSYSWPHCWTKLVEGTPQECPVSKKGKNKNIFTSKFELSSVFKIPRTGPGASKKKKNQCNAYGPWNIWFKE